MVLFMCTALSSVSIHFQKSTKRWEIRFNKCGSLVYFRINMTPEELQASDDKRACYAIEHILSSLWCHFHVKIKDYRLDPREGCAVLFGHVLERAYTLSDPHTTKGMYREYLLRRFEKQQLFTCSELMKRPELNWDSDQDFIHRLGIYYLVWQHTRMGDGYPLDILRNVYRFLI